jgi:hypothetical protein
VPIPSTIVNTRSLDGGVISGQEFPGCALAFSLAE